MSDISKQKFKNEFKKWAKDKTLDQIAEKVYEVSATTYDLAKKEILKMAFDKFGLTKSQSSSESGD